MSNPTRFGGTDGVACEKLSIGPKDAEVALTATPAELNKLDGVTAIVADLNAVAGMAALAGAATASKAVVLDVNKAVDAVRTASLMLGASGSEVEVIDDARKVTLGTSAAPITDDTADVKFAQLYADSGATSGDARGIYNKLSLTGAGGGGESLRSYTEIVGVAAANAHGAHISLGLGESTTAGSVTGLGVALRATLGLPNVALPANGTYAALMAEIYSFGANADAGAVTSLSVIRAVNGGDAGGQADVDDDAAFIEFDGFTAGDGNMIAAKAAAAAPNVTNSIRIKIGGVVKYIYVGETALTA